MISRIVLSIFFALLPSLSLADFFDPYEDAPEEHEFSARVIAEQDKSEYRLSVITRSEARDLFSQVQALHMEDGSAIDWNNLDRGCETRAAFAVDHLTEAVDADEIGKAFFFGDLKYSWNYHAVLVVETGHGYYALDARFPRPVPIADYIKSIQEGDGAIQTAICSPYTFSPINNCFETNPEKNTDRFGNSAGEVLRRIQD